MGEALEGDLVVEGARVRRREPHGVLADLVEPPLEVEQLQHLGIRVGLHPGVDEGAQVELSRLSGKDRAQLARYGRSARSASIR